MCKENFCRNPEDYRTLSRMIDREWNQALPPVEFAIIRFIFDRTAGWSKQWEQIPIRHFTECVISKKDGKNHGGVFSTSNTTIVAAIRSLVDRGALLREPTGRSFRYSINYEWEADMKTPKRLRTGSDRSNFCNDDRSNSCNDDVPDSGHIRSKKERALKKGSQPPAAVTDKKAELMQSVEKTRQQSASRREEHKKEGHFCRGTSGFVPKEGALRRIWEDLHNENFPDDPCAPLSQRALHMVRNYCREWNTRNKTKEFISDFLPWLFIHWSIVRVTSLSWMKDSPVVPQPMFVANSKMRPHLEESWAKREKIEAMAQMNPRDREIAVLRERGVDQEVAERMATEIVGQDDKLKRIKHEQRRLEVMQQYEKIKKPAKKLARSMRPSTSSENSLPSGLPSWDDLPE